jgi:aminocarboxymuconate-semialdehyde decarboxylase
MRTVDVHAHVLFPEVMGLCGAAGPEMGERDGVQWFRSGEYVLSAVRFTGSPFSDLALRLAAMDRLGVDHQLLSPNPLTYFYAQPVDAAAAFCAARCARSGWSAATSAATSPAARCPIRASTRCGPSTRRSACRSSCTPRHPTASVRATRSRARAAGTSTW